MFPEGRLFDFLIVGAVALIIVGPKDLPVLMRKVGRFMARVRGMAAEFRASFDELARQSELDELRREVQALRSARPMDFAATHLGAGEVFSGIKSDLADTQAEIEAHTASPFSSPALQPPAPPAETPPAPDAEPPAEPRSDAAPADDAAPKAPAS
ncbi:MAG TPA: Sec-independent protein translocase protein TatB [Caulobacteraceae bacterium]|nr:Sec-independent protein translocase protein TatB [Caulobacteraceae bacterium]